MASDPFLDMLLAKMSDGGLPQPVLDVVAADGARICRDYRPEDPHDIVILNNKVIQLRELADSAGISNGSGPVGEPLAGMIRRLLRSKA